MSAAIGLARAPYALRHVPNEYSPAWFATEFQNIQRALPSGRIQTVKAAYLATVQDFTILADATSAAFTISLPPATQVKGLLLNIKKADSSAHAVTIGGIIDGSANPTLATQYKSVTVQSDGVTWWKLGSV